MYNDSGATRSRHSQFRRIGADGNVYRPLDDEHSSTLTPFIGTDNRAELRMS